MFSQTSPSPPPRLENWFNMSMISERRFRTKFIIGDGTGGGLNRKSTSMQ